MGAVSGRREAAVRAGPMTYAVTRLLAHIERGVERDAFGRNRMVALCGVGIYTGSYRDSPGNRVGMKTPEFYRVCGSCRRIERQKAARQART